MTHCIALTPQTDWIAIAALVAIGMSVTVVAYCNLLDALNASRRQRAESLKALKPHGDI